MGSRSGLEDAHRCGDLVRGFVAEKASVLAPASGRFTEEHGDAIWRCWLEDIWPGCRNRYRELLESCRADARAVLLVDEWPDHAFGPELSGERIELPLVDD